MKRVRWVFFAICVGVFTVVTSCRPTAHSSAGCLEQQADSLFHALCFQESGAVYQQLLHGTHSKVQQLAARVGLMRIYLYTGDILQFFQQKGLAEECMTLISQNLVDLEDAAQQQSYRQSVMSFYYALVDYYHQNGQYEKAYQQLAQAKEILSDDDVERKHTELLLTDGGYPDNERRRAFFHYLEYLHQVHHQADSLHQARALMQLAQFVAVPYNYELIDSEGALMLQPYVDDFTSSGSTARCLVARALPLLPQGRYGYDELQAYSLMAQCHNRMQQYHEATVWADAALARIDTLQVESLPYMQAQLHEQLSIAYGAMGEKALSDSHRNEYLDILDDTKQDREVENRFMELNREVRSLNLRLFASLASLVLCLIFIVYYNERKRRSHVLFIQHLHQLTQVCRQITEALPGEGDQMDAFLQQTLQRVKPQLLTILQVPNMVISSLNPVKLQLVGIKKPSRHQLTLLKLIQPYFNWIYVHGSSLIQMDEELTNVEKRQYITRNHLTDSKKENIRKKSCLFMVQTVIPYIDRIVNETTKLLQPSLTPQQRSDRLDYIDELIERINEYNEILAQWIQIRQGSISLKIETVSLADLFALVARNKSQFSASQIELQVSETNLQVKADKALTLFMINTLLENARKYTPAGGSVCLKAEETDGYVEIAVSDTGIGLSSEDVQTLLYEKVYDSSAIGMKDEAHTALLKQRKGFGFGLMNCKGIIHSYQKLSTQFQVCCFGVDSTLGKGSRFYFRLPKIKRLWMLVLALFMQLGTYAITPYDNELVTRANQYAEAVYQSNLDNDFESALAYADSTLNCFNAYLEQVYSITSPQLELVGQGIPADATWFTRNFEIDYFTLLDVRNEAAVAFLALGNYDGYRYNNVAYTSLYRYISEDRTLSEYCTRMQGAANGRNIAISLMLVCFVGFLLAFAMVYYRRTFILQHCLERMLILTRRLFALDASQLPAVAWREQVLALLTAELSDGLPIQSVALCLPGEEPSDNSFEWHPLSVDIANETIQVGQLGIGWEGTAGKDGRAFVDMAIQSLSVWLYHLTIVIPRKTNSLELIRDEIARADYEKNKLHVQNQVLDNCFSSIKHETVYYPSKIKQLVDACRTQADADKLSMLSELVNYYRGIYSILTDCASKQVDEVTFRRRTVSVAYLLQYAEKMAAKQALSAGNSLLLSAESVGDACLIGDVSLLEYLIDLWLSVSYRSKDAGQLTCSYAVVDGFVRMQFTDSRTVFTPQQLQELFYPTLHMLQGKEGTATLQGTEFLICKQIIREHDAHTGKRGCRIGVEPAAGGGYTLWFMLPQAKNNSYGTDSV